MIRIIYEKIGDIDEMAITYGKMGLLFYEKEDFPTALESSIRAYLTFSQIGSPKAFQALKDIITVGTRLSDTVFKEILKKNGIPRMPSMVISPFSPA